MKKNVANQYVHLYAYNRLSDATETGDSANITAYLALDNTAIAQATNSVSEVDATKAPGVYKLALTQAETNANTLIVSATSTTNYVVIDPVLCYPYTASQYVVAGNAALAASADVQQDVEVYQQASGGDLIWTITDANGDAVDLSGSTLRLLVKKYDDSVLFTLGTGGSGITVGGDEDNEVTCSYSTANTATAATYKYELWQLDGGASGDVVLAEGAFVITPTVKEDA